MARANGIDIVAISDHDNLAAYFETKAYADSVAVTLVPAIELSCGFAGVDVHVLAYAFDALDPRIDQRLRTFRDARQRRGQAIVEKLRTIGIHIRGERVDELAAGGAVGRPHVARALVEGGHVKTVAEAFDRYLASGKPGYVEKARFQIAEAVELIHSAGGVTSVAHPATYPDHASIVPQLLDAGIDAVEVLHPDVNETERERYTNLARFRGKFITGGSDDHGKVKQVETLGSIKVPESWIGPILERCE